MLQQDLDIYKATLITTLRKNHKDILCEADEKVIPGIVSKTEEVVKKVSSFSSCQGISVTFDAKEGRLYWPVMLRELLDEQMELLLSDVVEKGGLNPYPVPKHRNKPLLEKALDFKGRDLDIIDKPVRHPDGWVMRVVKSSVDHREAGFGVRIDGACVIGTVVAIYPGKLWWPGTYEGVQGNEYAISRFDGVVIDAHEWDARAHEDMLSNEVLKAGLGQTSSTMMTPRANKYRNPYALGSLINHPAPGQEPNVMAVSYDFKVKDPVKRSFVPHEIASKKHPLYMFDYDRDEDKVIPSTLLVACRNILDEELFLNYRFNPSLPYPDWFKQPDEEEAKRRWSSFFSVK